MIELNVEFEWTNLSRMLEVDRDVTEAAGRQAVASGSTVGTAVLPVCAPRTRDMQFAFETEAEATEAMGRINLLPGVTATVVTQ